MEEKLGFGCTYLILSESWYASKPKKKLNVKLWCKNAMTYNPPKKETSFVIPFMFILHTIPFHSINWCAQLCLMMIWKKLIIHSFIHSFMCIPFNNVVLLLVLRFIIPTTLIAPFSTSHLISLTIGWMMMPWMPTDAHGLFRV